ncbi:MAG: hypothetical protein IJE07_08205 [Clostridia bacterium]|nr:hypothetical protein [Clostridia bacterium]
MYETVNGAFPVRVVRIAPFRAVTSGPDTPERVFGDFNAWQEAHMHLIRPMLCGAPDFLCGEDGKLEWLWAVKEGVTAADVQPYQLVEHPGGLYACAVTVDGDDALMARAHAGILQWIGGSGFEPDERPGRATMVHMLTPEGALRAALGYDQAEIFVPVRVKKGVADE